MEIVYQSPSGNLASIWIDTAIQVGHETTAEPTENPIESGAPVTDHVQVNLETVTYECVVTNTPLEVPQSNMDGATGSVQSRDLQGGLKANVFTWSGPFDRVRSIDEELRRLVKERTLVQVTGTRLRSYESMVIRRYSPKEDVASFASLVFTLELKQMSIVSTETVEVPDPEEPRGRDEESRGSVPAEDATPLRSVLRGLTERVFG